MLEAMEFQQREWAIDVTTQDRFLRLCDIDAGIYAENVDPSAFVALAIRETERNGVVLPAALHSGQRLVMRRPMRLGESMQMEGRVCDRQKVERGELLTCEARLRDGLGEVVLESIEQLLIPDPSVTAAKKSSSAAAVPALRAVASVRFRPEQVASYCGREVNPIHFDPEAAQRAGLRAPIIGGEQGVRHVMAALWKAHEPRYLDINLRFLRPVFWDDECTIVVEEKEGRWQTVSLAKAEKKAMEVAIDHMQSSKL